MWLYVTQCLMLSAYPDTYNSYASVCDQSLQLLEDNTPLIHVLSCSSDNNQSQDILYTAISHVVSWNTSVNVVNICYQYAYINWNLISLAFWLHPSFTHYTMAILSRVLLIRMGSLLYDCLFIDITWILTSYFIAYACTYGYFKCDILFHNKFYALLQISSE